MLIKIVSKQKMNFQKYIFLILKNKAVINFLQTTIFYILLYLTYYFAIKYFPNETCMPGVPFIIMLLLAPTLTIILASINIIDFFNSKKSVWTSLLIHFGFIITYLYIVIYVPN